MSRALIVIFIALLFVAVISATIHIDGKKFHVDVHPDARARHELLIDEDALLKKNPVYSAEIRVALKMRNMDKLERIALEVSDPTHKNYQEYLTREEVDLLVQPDQAKVAAFVAWLRNALKLDDATVKINTFSGFVEIAAPHNIRISQLAQAFNAHIQLYRRRDSARSVLVYRFAPASSYELPDEFCDDVVNFLQEMPYYHIINGGGSPYSGSGDMVVPQTLRALGNIGNYVFRSGKAPIGVLEFSCGFTQDDISDYLHGMDQAGPAAIQHKGTSGQSSNGECELDLQLIAGLGGNTTTWFLSTNGWFLEMAQLVGSVSDGPLLSSISYNSPESKGGPQSIQHQANLEYIKLAARGIGILGASGDSGCCDSSCNLASNFPPSSPFVTAVGATMIWHANGTFNGNNYCKTQTTSLQPCAAGGDQLPANGQTSGSHSGWYATGGGVSIREKLPRWQAAAVHAYLSNTSIPKPPGIATNRRMYPDIAANGQNTVIRRQGRWSMTGGTSAAAPIVAAELSVLNDVLIRHGKRPLGFAAPFLYQNARHFINSIGNSHTNNKAGCATGWVSSSQGWDPVTGNGNINVGAAIAFIENNLQLFKDAKKN